MEQYAGIDVSLDSASVCIVDAQGKILKEAKVACEPEALIAWFAAHGTPRARIGLEAGPLSQWLFAEMKAAGLAVELLETRHVRAAFKAMPVKTDRTDARGIAQLMRLGWFRPVHCKSLPAQEVRALLTTRKLLQAKRHDVEMSLRGVLRGFGLKVGPTTPKTFEGRVRELVAHHDTLQTIADALLTARAVLEQEFKAIEKRLYRLARSNEPTGRLMTTPGDRASGAVGWDVARPGATWDGHIQRPDFPRCPPSPAADPSRSVGRAGPARTRPSHHRHRAHAAPERLRALRRPLRAGP